MDNDDHRPALITGLRALADFLEANPAVPAPYRISGCHFPTRADDEVMCAEIDQIAALLGSEIDSLRGEYGHYATSIGFGPVTYEAVAILAARRARYQADASYDGCVQPNTPAHAA
ncbi:hypothetical protein [Microbispora sp. NPDC049125]|uniref:hypothetical protein n=1 Tax=Microbispora sp. NPDC049125 TaxID=3154929 RepID=UPI003467D972